ncbi:MAG: hypothetical protein K2L25_00470 [Alphaproteobacteria bacterium]|nr:hypothetical protein [Alphaproteobacteria bacterium]
MKISNRELESLIAECRRVAMRHGYDDLINLPLEWRPLGGTRLLIELATGYAIWPSGPKSTANAFIDAYGAYYDARNQLKYTGVAMQALRTVTR